MATIGEILDRARTLGTSHQVAATLFGHPGIEDSPKRRKVSRRTTHELYQLPGYKRQTASATVRDQKRAYSAMAWMIRRALDNWSRFTPYVNTGDDTVDGILDRLLAWHSLPRNFDALGRHSRDEWMRQFEGVKIIAGDCGGMKTQGLKLQGIEGDRIGIGTGVTVTAGYTILRDPGTGRAYRVSEEGCVFEENPDESVINADPMSAVVGGRVIGWAVCRRTGLRGEMLVFERVVPAENMIFDGYWPERFDANRGVSPLLPVLNQCADVLEAREYTILKVKVGAMFGFGFERTSEDELANRLAQQSTSSVGQDGLPATPTNTEKESYAATVQRQVDARGLLVVDMDPGDKLHEFQSTTPNAEVVPFTREIVREILLALDLPFTMYDSLASSFSARELDRNEFDEACEWKRDKNEAVLREVYSPDWCLGGWQKMNMFGLGDAMKSAKMDIENAWAGIDWHPSGRPEPTLEEIKTGILSISAGLNSTPRFLARYGQSEKKIIDEQEKYLKRVGNRVPVFLASPGQETIKNLMNEPARQEPAPQKARQE